MSNHLEQQHRRKIKHVSEAVGTSGLTLVKEWTSSYSVTSYSCPNRLVSASLTPLKPFPRSSVSAAISFNSI